MRLTCELSWFGARQVTALCWRPDGKLIIAGLAGACAWQAQAASWRSRACADGSLSFHDAENGEVGAASTCLRGVLCAGSA